MNQGMRSDVFCIFWIIQLERANLVRQMQGIPFNLMINFLQQWSWLGTNPEFGKGTSSRMDSPEQPADRVRIDEGGRS